MSMKRKKTMVAARVSSSVVDRVDFVVRNSEPDVVRNRSAAIETALLAWLSNEETRLEKLGILPRKTRQDRQ